MTEEQFAREKKKIDKKIYNLDCGDYEIEDYFRLIKKARKINTRLRDIRLGKEKSESIVNNLTDHPTTASISDDGLSSLINLTVGSGALAGLYIACKHNPNALDSVTNGDIAPILTGGIAGALVAGIGTQLHIKRVIPNIIDDFRLKYNKNKLDKLNQKEVLERYYLEGVQDTIEDLLSVQFSLDNMDNRMEEMEK